jgi:hypothetical protein
MLKEYLIQAKTIKKLTRDILATDTKAAKTLPITRTLSAQVVRGRRQCIQSVLEWYANGLVSKELAVELILSSAVWGVLRLTVTTDLTKTQ